jgi:putative SOS response-associated peptidase YedK
VLAIRLDPETKQRSLDRLRWGLVPYWAKDEKIGFKTINARAETIDTAHSFRSAFKKRRCLIPADGFYEWKKVTGGKIPHSIEMKNDSPFVFAGLWEGWENPETQEWLRTCTIITGQPNELVAEIHTRMPVILPPENPRPMAHRTGVPLRHDRSSYRPANPAICTVSRAARFSSCSRSRSRLCEALFLAKITWRKSSPPSWEKAHNVSCLPASGS